MSDLDSIFPDYPVASFEVGGLKYAFPVLDIRESGGNRIVPRERPYRDGAKLDDTGSQPKVWTMKARFNNTLQEVGLSAINGQLALYPDVLNQLIIAFDVHETGTLTVPTIGEQRARATNYSRIETFNSRSEAAVELTFTEDNEDTVDFRVITTPTANADASRLAQTTTFDAQSEGDWDQFFADIESFVNELEDLSNSPQNTASQIKTRGRQVRDIGRKIVKLHTQPGLPGFDSMVHPRGNRTERKVTRQRGTAARAANEAGRGRPKVITVALNRQSSLFALAAYIEQDFGDLVEINPDLDPTFLPQGTHVNIYSETGTIR